MSYRDRIIRDPQICGGEPVIKGTRVIERLPYGVVPHAAQRRISTSAPLRTAASAMLSTCSVIASDR